MSSGVKLVLMGVAGAALLYSCTPGVGAGLGALPYLWFLPNPFFRGPAVSGPQTPGNTAPNMRPGGTATSPSATLPDAPKATAVPTQSQRGGFGSTGSSTGTSGSS